MTRRITLEIAVSTPDEAALAERHGADRLELSSALELGGLTPSMGLFRAVRSVVTIPLLVLVRPRPGDFCYSAGEFEAMLADAKAFTDAGAAGLVVGVLTADGAIDRPRCRELVAAPRGQVVFHRAFDSLADPFRALDDLAELGFRRVLTSGGQITAAAGTSRLAALIAHAGSRVEVLPGGGIRPQNVAALVRETRCDQVHSSARAPAPAADQSEYRAQTSAELVAGLRSELDRVALSLSSPV